MRRCRGRMRFRFLDGQDGQSFREVRAEVLGLAVEEAQQALGRRVVRVDEDEQLDVVLQHALAVGQLQQLVVHLLTQQVMRTL